jgi:hypothetical protein
MNRRSLLGWLAKAPVALAAVSLPGACASVPVMAGEALTTHPLGYVPTGQLIFAKVKVWNFNARP